MCVCVCLFRYLLNNLLALFGYGALKAMGQTQVRSAGGILRERAGAYRGTSSGFRISFWVI